MEKILAFFLGLASVRVQCACPEEVLNACAGTGIVLRKVQLSEDGLTLCVRRRDLAALRCVCTGLGARISAVRVYGVLPFAERIRKRYVLLAGAVICILAVWLSSLFIWQITVSGNTGVRTDEILSQLEELGVHIGACRLTVNQSRISNEMLRRLTDLSWIAVNISGSRARVTVREETPAPEIADESTPAVICAGKSGVISSMTVRSGAAAAAVGDTVQAGDILVTGQMDSISSGSRYVHAQAQIRARTWYTMSAIMPVNARLRTPGTEARSKNALIFGKNRLNLYFDSGIFTAEYDKIINGRDLSFLGSVLPVRTEKTEIFASVLEETQIPEADAVSLLQRRLTQRLQTEIGENGRIVSTDFSTQSGNGTVTVILRAECEEEIGQTRVMTQDELAARKPEDKEDKNE